VRLDKRGVAFDLALTTHIHVFNSLNEKGALHIRTQCVPRSKHSNSIMQRQSVSAVLRQNWLFVLRSVATYKRKVNTM